MYGMTGRTAGRASSASRTGSVPLRVIIADDSSDTRLLLRNLLQRWDYDILEAQCGEEVLELLDNHEIDIVLSDWMMPGMNGIELCRIMRERDQSRYVYFILLTSKDNQDAVVEGMEAGADDFLQKPVRSSELKVRLLAGKRILGLQDTLSRRNQDLMQTHQKLKAAYDQIEIDLTAAAQMQANLLPRSHTVEGLALSWLYAPSSFIGGDMFSWVPTGPHHYAFFHIDVSGHGVPAALLSFSLYHMLVNRLSHNESSELASFTPGKGQATEVVRDINRRMSMRLTDGRYFTMVLGLGDTNTGEVEIVQAGHPSPILLRHNGEMREIGQGGFPVGMFGHMTYDSILLTLEPGDRLVMFSDGITECFDPDNDMFGIDRLKDTLLAAHKEPIDGLLQNVHNELDRWRGPRSLDDDISAIAFEFQGLSEITSLQSMMVGNQKEPSIIVPS